MTGRWIWVVLITLSSNLWISQLWAQTPSVTFNTEKRAVTVTQVTDRLEHPWSIAFISATHWLVTERPGRLRRVVDGKLQEAPITGLPEIAAVGQGGLLDVVLHPDFAENKWVYLSYSAKRLGSYGTEVARGKLVDNKLEDTEIIFKALPKVRGGRHFGSRLAFDSEGFLYISLGDRGLKNSAQELDQHSGSLIRLHDDGSVPADNPFVGDPSRRPEIFSYGHRNVQGMVFDSLTDTLWTQEHGPQGGDELNKIEPGANYGWPVITYGANYGTGTRIGEGTEKDGMQQPSTFWDPSIAPSGLEIVSSSEFDEWSGNLLVGALKFQLIARLELVDGKVVHEERLFRRKFGRIRDVREAPDGLIYFLTDEENGKIYRMQ